jgi:hypothetical protein
VQQVRKPAAVHCELALDPGDFLARVVAFEFRSVGVLDALGVNDEKGGLLLASVKATVGVDGFFLRPGRPVCGSMWSRQTR